MNYPRIYSKVKQLVQIDCEITQDKKGKYQIRLVKYYLEHDTETTDWRGNFDTYQKAHEIGMWWRSHP